MSTLSQFSGGRIKSIQRGVITMPAGGGNLPSVSVIITAVDTQKSILYNLGVTRIGVFSQSIGASNDGIGSIPIGLVLTNSTIVTASATGAQAFDIISFEGGNRTYGSVSWQLVEYF
jgi:hypothetical protein